MFNKFINNNSCLELMNISCIINKSTIRCFEEYCFNFMPCCV